MYIQSIPFDYLNICVLKMEFLTLISIPNQMLILVDNRFFQIVHSFPNDPSQLLSKHRDVIIKAVKS